MRGRVIGLVVAGAAIAALLLLFRPPVEHDLVVRLGAQSARVREVDLHFLRDGATERDLTLSFPEPAPAEVRRAIKLRRGRYDVAARIVLRDGREAHVGRVFDPAVDETIDLEDATAASGR